MLRVRTRTEDVLVLGLSRFEEMAALFFVLGSLFQIGLACQQWDDPVARWPQRATLAALVLALGAWVLFFHEKYVFCRSRGTLTRGHLPWKKETWLLADIEQVELLRAWQRYAACKIAFKDGSRLSIMGASSNAVHILGIAQTLATFLSVPLNSRDIT
jgi:hypothetical protein